MLGEILKIDEVMDYKISKHIEGDGYNVVTDLHNLCLLIENHQSCCEYWGYFDCQDNADDFIGSQLLEIKLTDTALNERKIKEIEEKYKDDPERSHDIQFVDFITDRGVFQLAAYNAHNGYYGHDVYVVQDADVLLEREL